MWFPTTGEIIDLHDRIIERTGGELGVIYRGGIDAAIERARWGPFRGQGTLAERAALLLRGIAQDHPFVDGNKRTAWEATEIFLAENGARLEAGDEEAISFILAAAQRRMDLWRIAHWIRRHQRSR